MILCATEPSVVPSEPALKTAAALAKKQGSPLLLAAVIPRPSDAARREAELRLEHEAAELSRDFAIEVEAQVLEGVPEQRLLEHAKSCRAQLIVVAAEGSSRRSRRLGSVPEHLCQIAELPVLVARSADGMIEWSRGGRELRAMLGSGLGDASTSALERIGAWPDLALTVVHVAWPYGEHHRLGVSGPMPLDQLRPEVRHQLLGDMERWTAQARGGISPKLMVIPGWGRIDSHLAQVAHDERADVLVVGSHRRNVAARLWHGSVSRQVIREASCNVLCVPQVRAPGRIAARPRVVVVPTDFSTLADRALGVGYALTDPGATLHLVHVCRRQSQTDRTKLKAQLAERVPADAEARGVSTELHVLEGETPWLAIWQYASRASADLICMATHSRDVTGSLVLGSQSQALLQHSRVPLVLVPPDRES